MENNLAEYWVASTSKISTVQIENPDEIKTSLRKETLADLTKTSDENQKELLKLITPAVRKTNVVQNLDNSYSEAENILPNTT